MGNTIDVAELLKDLEYFSPDGEYAVRQLQLGPDNQFGKIEIVDVKRYMVLFTLPDEVTYVVGSEYEKDLGWYGKNDLFLFVFRGRINPKNNRYTNEIIHISLRDKAVVERFNPLRRSEAQKALSIFPVGYIIRSSPDRRCYIKVSGAGRITVCFGDAKCVFNDVIPMAGHPFLAKWSPNCNACCFMGKHSDSCARLIIIFLDSNGNAGMDAWNLGRVPDRVIFEEREGMSDLCVPVLQGKKIYKSPFYYDDSIYESAKLVYQGDVDEFPKRTVRPEWNAGQAGQAKEIKPANKTVKTAKTGEKKERGKFRDFLSDLVGILKFIAIKSVIGIGFLILALAGIYGLGKLVSLLKG